MILLNRYWLVLISLIATSIAANALVLSPVRCQGDNLEQWKHDLNPSQFPDTYPPDGSARGRNAWWLVCRPSEYMILNNGYSKVGIAAEKDPTANHSNGTITRWYPTFGILTGFNQATGETQFSRPGNWVAPTVAPASAGDASCNLPADYQLVGMCASGCVTPEQEVATDGDYRTIVDLENIPSPTVLVPSNFTEGKSFDLYRVRSFIKDGTDALQKIAIIETKSGGSIRVSLNHPLLTQDFTMQRADKIKIGNSLIQADGKPDEIISIRVEEYFGKLHNLTVDSAQLEKSVYIVRGYISGDKKHQDIALSDANRKIMRQLVK